MAKLLAPFTLCPLVEHKKCLGVCEDSTPGCVIVTLGRNIVIRYRLSDQKQLSFWSSQDKLSAPVICDFTSNRYLAVFKSEQIAFWLDSVVELNKLKKSKFSRLIHCLLSTKDCPPVVVYQKGNIGMLKDELESRRNVKDDEEFLSETELIVSSSIILISGNTFVNLLTEDTKSNVKRLHCIPVDSDRADRFSVTLTNNDTNSFNAYTIIQCESTSLITLWSDGNIYSVELPLKDERSFPGKLLSKLNSINLSQQAVIHSLGEQQMVIYGAAPNSEGAVLCIFNLKYGLIDSLQKLKVYSDTPKLWVVGELGTNRYCLCLSGGHLIVIPTRFITQKLSSLVGVAKINNDDLKSNTSQVILANWKSSNDICIEENDKMEIDHKQFTTKILKLRNAGFTDNKICEELLPELLETSDQEHMIELLSVINDVPDNWLIEMAIKFIEEHFKPLLEIILRRPLVSDITSLQAFRSKLNLPIALKLLTAICKMMDEHPLDKNVLDWACLLLDSNYQQYLLSKDEAVIELMKELHSRVKLHMEFMEKIKSLRAELISFKKGHIQFKKNSVSSHSYLVDSIRLY